MNKVLGIDIGISSVGWGLIDADEGTYLVYPKNGLAV